MFSRITVFSRIGRLPEGAGTRALAGATSISRSMDSGIAIGDILPLAGSIWTHTAVSGPAGDPLARVAIEQVELVGDRAAPLVADQQVDLDLVLEPQRGLEAALGVNPRPGDGPPRFRLVYQNAQAPQELVLGRLHVAEVIGEMDDPRHVGLGELDAMMVTVFVHEGVGVGVRGSGFGVGQGSGGRGLRSGAGAEVGRTYESAFEGSIMVGFAALGQPCLSDPQPLAPGPRPLTALHQRPAVRQRPGEWPPAPRRRRTTAQSPCSGCRSGSRSGRRGFPGWRGSACRS